MHIAVIGASGRSGRATIHHALAAGHAVTSVVRNPAKAPVGTSVARADARDSVALTEAVRGTPVFISWLPFASFVSPFFIRLPCFEKRFRRPTARARSTL